MNIVATGESDHSDLTNALAIVVPLPPELWYSPAVVQARYWDTLENETLVAATRNLGNRFPHTLAINRYQIGPTAEWSYTNIYALFNDVRPLLENIVTLLSIADFARRMGQFILRNSNRRPVFTAHVITSLCLAWTQHDHPNEKLSIQFQVREEWPYHTVSHPGGLERYVVWIEGDRRVRYCYIVTGQALVIEHFRLRRGRIELLDLPDLLEDKV